MRRERVERTGVEPIDDLEPAVEMFDEGGAALDPIAVVAVEHAADLFDVGLMDVPADDAIDAALPCFVDNGVGKVAHELDRVLDARLQIGGERPIRIAEAAADDIEIVVEPEAERIGPVAQQRQPLRIPYDAIEGVAVNDEELAAIRGDVDHLIEKPDAAHLQLRVVAQPFVMVARDVDDPRPLARLAQQLLDNVVVGLRPKPGTAQAPAVDDVADEIEMLGFRMAEKIEQEFRLAAARS